MTRNLSDIFPEYHEYAPLVPVWCVTPNLDRTIHRFFDTSPISPSGRYLGLTRLPFEDRLPTPGDTAEIVTVDLETGKTQIVAETHAWSTQLGAQVQWGQTDAELIFNDMNIKNWKVGGVVLNPSSGERRILNGEIYMVSQDGRLAISPNLKRMSNTQFGYGVHIPEDIKKSLVKKSELDGVFITNIRTGEVQMLRSLDEIVEKVSTRLNRLEYVNGNFYIFHVKWNLQSDRILLVLRWVPKNYRKKMRSQVVTMNSEGSDIHVAVSESLWDRGGHHPNWCPDGEYVMMNLVDKRTFFSKLLKLLPGRIKNPLRNLLNINDDGMRFVSSRYSGSDYHVLVEDMVGTGHPTMHPNGKFIITDAYLKEIGSFGDGTVPIRLINMKTNQEDILVRINTRPFINGENNELRVDPHPAWDREYKRIVFNGFVDGTRRVFIADLTKILSR